MEVNKHLLPWMEVPKDILCTLRDDPALWSEDVISQAMRSQAAAASIQDARSFIKAYLNVLCANG